MTNLVEISGLFATARARSSTGERTVYAATCGGLAVCTFIALTLAAGTYMFYDRWKNPRGLYGAIVAKDPTFSVVGLGYATMAGIACALLVPAITSLAVAAATAGTRARQNRLAVLRLVGLSSRQIVALSLVDTAVQVVLATVAGTVLYAACIPLWMRLSFLAQPVGLSDLVMPVWLYAATVTITGLVAFAATWLGLAQLIITPLAVSKKQLSGPVRWWRPILFVLCVAGFIGFQQIVGKDAAPGSFTGRMALSTAVVIVLVIFAATLVGPWFMQLFGRILARVGGPVPLWVGRRIQADPRQTWGYASGLLFLSLIAGYTTLMPITVSAMDEDTESFSQLTQQDIARGALVAIAFSFILAAVTVYLTQLDDCYQRADQSVALMKLGAPPRYQLSVTWLAVMGSVTVATVTGFVLGILAAWPMWAILRDQGLTDEKLPLKIALAVVIVLAGLAVTALAVSNTNRLRLRLARRMVHTRNR
ncbi:hypothetical protein ACFSSC_09340 [Corynebacterium mendelii]|uniref:ABC transporter permease n=1 Tax=Corynebacterium mendelii TaxID=2765362 RepID=A0A939E3U8_9CORY|nr:hypothetical protein [Corynebacterium mendelii]MBN9645181.1 hypothetical protein [Corynebacterium mendelii]